MVLPVTIPQLPAYDTVKPINFVFRRSKGGFRTCLLKPWLDNQHKCVKLHVLIMILWNHACGTQGLNHWSISAGKHSYTFTEDPTSIPTPSEASFPSMPETVISQEGVLKLLKDLKENKASGPDNIPSWVLKVAAEPVSICLQHLFTASLRTGTVPNDWKQANITPVFKKGERFKASNYRPVSLTCVCSKLMEHVIVSQVMGHFDQPNILADCQHGF